MQNPPQLLNFKNQYLKEGSGYLYVFSNIDNVNAGNQHIFADWELADICKIGACT